MPDSPIGVTAYLITLLSYWSSRCIVSLRSHHKKHNYSGCWHLISVGYRRFFGAIREHDEWGQWWHVGRRQLDGGVCRYQRTTLDGDSSCRPRGIDLQEKEKVSSFPATTQVIVKKVNFAHCRRRFGQVASNKKYCLLTLNGRPTC